MTRSLARPMPLTAIAVAAIALAAPLALGYSGMPTGAEDPPSSNPSFEQELVELVNAARMAEGLSPLKRIGCLDRAARYQANDMVQDFYFAHDTQDAGGVFVCTWSQRLVVFCPSMSATGDLIGAGYTSPSAMLNSWLGSEPHRQLIMYAGSRETGAGYRTGGQYGRYWVQDFGLYSGVYPILIDGENESTGSPSVSLYLYGAGFWTEMRLRNDGADWGPWIPFETNVAWQLRSEPGTRSVYAEMRNATSSTESMDSIELAIAIDVEEADASVAGVVPLLEPARPNPFQGSTTISFRVSESGPVALRIHDVTGRAVCTLVDGVRDAGEHEVVWLGSDDSGRRLSAGIYVCVLTSARWSERRTVVLIR